MFSVSIFRRNYQNCDNFKVARTRKLQQYVPPKLKFRCLSQFLSHPNPCSVASLAFRIINTGINSQKEDNDYLQRILFLSFFSNSPIPSRTFVMSYMRRFLTCCQKPSVILYQQGPRYMLALMRREEIYTTNISATLFKSKMPSSACLSKLMNFLVNSPEQTLHRELSEKLISNQAILFYLMNRQHSCWVFPEKKK